MSERTRMTPDQRRSLIVAAGVRLANGAGLWKVTAPNVAKECEPEVHYRTVVYYFPTKVELQRAVIDTGELNTRAMTQAGDAGLL